ncbi:Segregation and condensation protein B [Nitrospira sp. KM1]|uniref:SMC-Scp complex subunit ScpB n=1 Tax=Nitrospira sp. KM1 TaxID=1936990 RepID=UPI0013A752D4|nr:SMC-Scp complex subunit ScpB [Nitrospira sp. KM1]BCA56865.1 Segregation and condensation protein B [Nitrospira sp. KM1]
MSPTDVQDEPVTETIESLAEAGEVLVSAEGPTGEQDATNPACEPPAQEDACQGRALTSIVEALLFVSGEPVSLSKLTSVIGTVSKAEVEQALKTLEEQFNRDERGIQLVKVAGGYRLVTKADVAPWLKKLDKAKASQRLSRSGLESLAIIAYKQPIVRAEIEEIRGVETSGVIRTLLERKLVRIVGRKEVPGRPIMYGTTKFFLEHFGLQDLSQLPPLREFKELGEAEQAMLPIEETTIIGQDETDESAHSGDRQQDVEEEGTGSDVQGRGSEVTGEPGGALLEQEAIEQT